MIQIRHRYEPKTADGKNDIQLLNCGDIVKHCVHGHNFAIDRPRARIRTKVSVRYDSKEEKRRGLILQNQAKVTPCSLVLLLSTNGEHIVRVSVRP